MEVSACALLFALQAGRYPKGEDPGSAGAPVAAMRRVARAHPCVRGHRAPYGGLTGMLGLHLTFNQGPSGITAQLRTFETLDDEEAGVAASVKELEQAGGAPPRSSRSLQDQPAAQRDCRSLGERCRACRRRCVWPAV